jgi:hypothetical protein
VLNLNVCGPAAKKGLNPGRDSGKSYAIMRALWEKCRRNKIRYGEEGPPRGAEMR